MLFKPHVPNQVPHRNRFLKKSAFRATVQAVYSASLPIVCLCHFFLFMNASGILQMVQNIFTNTRTKTALFVVLETRNKVAQNRPHIPFDIQQLNHPIKAMQAMGRPSASQRAAKTLNELRSRRTS